MSQSSTIPMKTSEEIHHGLKIIVVGAGIGGLSAAIMLKMQGHSVTIYESSKFATELGAAIHIPPNACGILNRMGIEPLEIGANECKAIHNYKSNGHLIAYIDTTQTSFLWKHKWTLGHRILLHNALKDKAKAIGVNLVLASPVTDVEPESGTVIFQDEKKDQADVVIGADGVHSICRKRVPGGEDKEPISSGKSAFRFLIPRQAILDDPQTRSYVEQDGLLFMAFHTDRRMVMYATRDNTQMNFVCIHPEEETSQVSGEDWNNKATKDLLLKVMEVFHPDFKAILGKVDESSLKIWNLLDMEALPSWTTGRLALLGDAAHPFLPHQDQGGAVAIEDAAAIGVVLEYNGTPDQVQERLKLYQDIRKSRADTIQKHTRLVGEDLVPGQSPKLDQRVATTFNFGHDEYDNSTQKLREWKWTKQPASYWTMPIAFGPMPGPRQSFEGKPRDLSESTTITSSITFKTSRTMLQNFFPPGSKQFSFTSPGTVAFASISQVTLDGLEWLGGKGYDFIRIQIHGVTYIGKDGKTIQGTYVPVLWENLTDSILSGREELGMPKLYSEIVETRHKTTQIVQTSWRGAKWGYFEWIDLEEVDKDVSSHSKLGFELGEGILMQRYIPSVGRDKRGISETEYTVFEQFPSSLNSKITRILKSKKGYVSIEPQNWTTLPTQHHIIARLADIPIFEVVDARIVEAVGISDSGQIIRV